MSAGPFNQNHTNDLEDLTMSTKSMLTAQTRAEFVDDAPDLAPLGPRPIKLLQNNSPEVMRGDSAYVPGAEGGDFLAPRGEEMALCKGTTGIEVVFVSFEECFLEWPAVRGAGNGGPMDRHFAMPSDANWVLDQSTNRKVCLRTNGNKIEKTIYGHALVDGAPATFVFRSTAYSIGRNHANLTFHAKATIDGEEIRVVGAKWCVTSRLERNDRGSWYVLRIDLIGKFGAPNGPTLAEARAAKALRIALKTGAEPPAIDAPKTPQLPAAPLAGDGGPAFNSVKAPSSEPPPAPPPPDGYDGPDDEVGDRIVV
jgi:hypothetical protein